MAKKQYAVVQGYGLLVIYGDETTAKPLIFDIREHAETFAKKLSGCEQERMYDDHPYYWVKELA